MKNHFVILGVIAMLLFGVAPARALSPAHLWSNGLGSSLPDVAYSAAWDNNGSVYVTGSFTGTVTFGNDTLVGQGNSDVFLVRLAPDGTVIWARSLGGSTNEYGLSVACSQVMDRIYITGTFAGVMEGLSSAGGNDVYVAAYQGDGSLVLLRRYGGTLTDSAQSIALINGVNPIVTGYFNGSVNFGGGPLVSAGSNDVFVMRLVNNGDHIWTRRAGGTGSDIGREVAVDGSGNVIVTGEFRNTADFSGGNLVSAGDSDIFLAKYDGNGTLLLRQSFGSTGADVGNSVAADASNNIFLTGSFDGTVNFGGSNLVSQGSDIFLAKYNGGGVHQWSQRFGAAGNDSGSMVATNAGDVFIAGTSSGTVDFGGGSIPGIGQDDAFMAKFDADGTHAWSRLGGGAGNDFGYAVAVAAPDQYAVSCGWFETTANFGGSAINCAGSTDAFVATYSGEPVPPMITSITDVGNDQGGSVLIHFNRSGVDDPLSSNPVWQYQAFRRNDPPTGWTQVATVQAHGDPTYSLVAPTIGDSTVANGQYWSVFYIRATMVPSGFVDSEPDSGYSLDNLAPAVPTNLVYAAGQLTWNPSAAQDFDHFTVYGSNTDSFGSAIVIDYTSTQTLNVSGAPYAFYYVTATDQSGNEGKPAKAGAAVTGAGDLPRHYVLSISNYPNPFNPRTTVSYTVPSRGPVTVAIYDAHGSRIATLVSNVEKATGAYSVEWTGHDDRGSVVASGIYFARIEHAGAVRTKKLVLLK